MGRSPRIAPLWLAAARTAAQTLAPEPKCDILDVEYTHFALVRLHRSSISRCAAQVPDRQIPQVI